MSAVTGEQYEQRESRSVLIHPGKPPVALQWVADDPCKPAHIFSVKFRLISGHDTGTRSFQPAAVSAPSVGT